MKLKKEYIIAAAIAIGVCLLWYGLREYNTMKASEDLGILISDMELYQGSDAWNEAENWDGYEFGDPLPEAVKKQ